MDTPQGSVPAHAGMWAAAASDKGDTFYEAFYTTNTLFMRIYTQPSYLRVKMSNPGQHYQILRGEQMRSM
jgi:hypothetical protein